MNIVCMGGGPSGLRFALLMKQQNPAHEVTVVERRAYHAFVARAAFGSAGVHSRARRCDPRQAR